MAKVPITELPIYTFTCVSHPEQPAMAVIGNLPMTFRAASPVRARIAAQKFITEEVERQKKADAAKLARAAGRKKARETAE